ncbi:hypothetical protein PCCS19_35830 [Paenibacillus sp. CCS19]|uniref:hypothetical protein n=1 Tax=Paenibacillus sp. CCS19 TaxID=3158387 RepID=UPI0025697B54|nr:hypothetical protein [Paenibacillus cellulosilyticus]GMK40527.1 hypothetical protein PCCS19_35830 [Paenibacillus cellulosilyticus]
MNELILPIYKPFFLGYQHHANCFSMLDLDNDPLYRKWFMNHFIQLMCSKEFVKNRNNLLDFYREDFYEAYSEIMVVQNVHQNIIKNYSKGIMGFIFDCIDDEHYMELIVNEFYIPGTKAYQKFDHDHGVFIYGYNKAEQIVYARYFKNELFSDTTLTFEEIENAFGNVVMTYHWCAHSKLFKKTKSVEMNVDVPRIMHSIEDLMKSRVRYRSNEYRVYGLQVYQCIKEHALLLDENMAFDIRPLHIVCEHKIGMVKRFEIAEQLGLGWDTSFILPKIKDLAERFNMLRYKFLKCILQQNKGSIPMLLSQLDQLEQEEYNLYEQILQDNFLEAATRT